ncbi:MAG: histidine phosphatase family protein [Actinobacteria bacterium]|nr:histidine phosphatase family protein [Actinomycetota bacterium]
MRIEIVFESHSTSTQNEAGIATGWLEGALSEAGKRQALELRERRRRKGVAAVYTSDLACAVETAEIAFGSSGIPIHREWRLRECNYGHLNGGPASRVGETKLQHIVEPFPGGESYRQVVERVGAFLDDPPRTLEDQRIVVVGHSVTRWAIEHLLTGAPLEQLVGEHFEWRDGWEYTLSKP